MTAVTALPAPYATLRIYANDGSDLDVLYHSQSETYEVYYTAGNEFGDEIDLVTLNRPHNGLDEFSFEAYGDAVEGVTAVDAVAEVLYTAADDTDTATAGVQLADGTTVSVGDVKTAAVTAVTAVTQGTATLRIYANDGDVCIRGHTWSTQRLAASKEPRYPALHQ